VSRIAFRDQALGITKSFCVMGLISTFRGQGSVGPGRGLGLRDVNLEYRKEE